MNKRDEQMKRRKRINRMKTALILIAFLLIVISITMNVVLCIRVVELNQMVQQLYGL